MSERTTTECCGVPDIGRYCAKCGQECRLEPSGTTGPADALWRVAKGDTGIGGSIVYRGTEVSEGLFTNETEWFNVGGKGNAQMVCDALNAVAGPSDSGSHETHFSQQQEKTKMSDGNSAALLDAAEMLWTVVANVSGGDWTEQTPEWQQAAARYRDKYFAALAASASAPAADAGICMFCDGCGWCEGSPAFTCPRCKGTGLAASPASALVTKDGI
jgi:hypothetical protein